MTDQTTKRQMWCCGCSTDVDARLTDGREIYPHRPDLSDLPFWKCDVCTNNVGCHHKTQDRTRPLGVISTPEMKAARQHIHALIDPIWKGGHLPRGHVYARLTAALGRQYHTADLRTLDEARSIYRAGQEIAKELATTV
jgi:hypothetical protein